MSVEKENLNSKKQTSESVVERSKSEVFCILFVRRRKGKTTRSLTTLHPGAFGIDTVLVFSFKYVPTSLLAWY